MNLRHARRVLGLPASSTLTLDQVKKVYRPLARKYHPDTGAVPDPGLFQELTEAYQLLTGPGGLEAPPARRRRVTADDFFGFGAKPFTPGNVTATADALRDFDEVLAGFSQQVADWEAAQASRTPPREVRPTEDTGFGARGVFHDTGWTIDRADGDPYLVVEGLPPGVKLVAKQGDRSITLMAPDGSALTIDFEGAGIFRPPGG